MRSTALAGATSRRGASRVRVVEGLHRWLQTFELAENLGGDVIARAGGPRTAANAVAAAPRPAALCTCTRVHAPWPASVCGRLRTSTQSRTCARTRVARSRQARWIRSQPALAPELRAELCIARLASFDKDAADTLPPAMRRNLKFWVEFVHSFGTCSVQPR